MINDFISREDLSLFTSGGRLTMGAVLLKEGKNNSVGTFDLFIRDLPDCRNYFVFAGLEHIVDFLINFHFTTEQLQYLESTYEFDQEIMNYYKNFKFTGHVHAMSEGTICFPNEPIIRVTAPIIEGMIIEQFMINTVMLQTMQASKMSRIMSVVGDKKFGITFSRTHGLDAAMKAVRTGKIVGVQLAALPLAAMKYKSYKPEGGVLSHYFIMSFPDELSAFRAYAKHFGSRGLFLIDTYNDLQGIKNFIAVAKESEKQGTRLRGLTIDSGDLYKLSVKARRMLDAAGLNYAQILVMSDLNEYKIKKLQDAKAPIDIYGAATEVLNVTDAPKLEVVYKLSNLHEHGKDWPKMKLATKKISLPGKKQVFRVKKDNKNLYDIIGLETEKITGGQKLLNLVIKNGRLIKPLPGVEAIHDDYKKNIKNFSQNILDINKKYNYGVRISTGLNKLIKETKLGITKKLQD